MTTLELVVADSADLQDLFVQLADSPAAEDELQLQIKKKPGSIIGAGFPEVTDLSVVLMSASALHSLAHVIAAWFSSRRSSRIEIRVKNGAETWTITAENADAESIVRDLSSLGRNSTDARDG